MVCSSICLFMHPAPVSRPLMRMPAPTHKQHTHKEHHAFAHTPVSTPVSCPLMRMPAPTHKQHTHNTPCMWPLRTGAGAPPEPSAPTAAAPDSWTAGRLDALGRATMHGKYQGSPTMTGASALPAGTLPFSSSCHSAQRCGAARAVHHYGLHCGRQGAPLQLCRATARNAAGLHMLCGAVRSDVRETAARVVCARTQAGSARALALLQPHNVRTLHVKLRPTAAMLGQPTTCCAADLLVWLFPPATSPPFRRQAYPSCCEPAPPAASPYCFVHSP